MIRSAIVVVVLAVFSPSPLALADEAVLNLGPEEFVRLDGNDIVVPGYSVPSFEDWNGDQLKDLVVGEGGNSFTGKVRVYLNRGTEADPCFTDYSYVRADGRDLTCIPQGCLGAFPRVVYWDEDERKDLLVGLGDGTVKIFLNVASDNEPAFDAGTFVTVGSETVLNLDVGARATPVPVDWNNDGLLDLVAGAADGAIRIYLSSLDGSLVPGSVPGLLVPGQRSSPVILDLDGDGNKDLLTGNTDGQILFCRNIGLDSQPTFSGYFFVQSAGKPIDLSGTGRSRPFVCHWTGDGHLGAKDGYWDLLVGYGDGKVHLYRGLPKRGDFDADGDLDADDFTFIARALDKPIPPGGTPADLNDDAVVDVTDLRLFAALWLAANGAE